MAWSNSFGDNPNFDKAADKAMDKASSVPADWNNLWTSKPAAFQADPFVWPEGNIDFKQLKSQGSNLVDDQQYLYFQCDGCNEILDPHTQSFAKLQEHRVKAGWKCIWNEGGMGYKVYCGKCEP